MYKMDCSGSMKCITCRKQISGDRNGDITLYCVCAFKICCFTYDTSGMDMIQEVVPVAPSGPPSQTFIQVYSLNEQKLTGGTAVAFEAHNSCYGCCAHEPNSSEIWLWNPGYYQVYSNLYHLEACQFSLVKNSNTIFPEHTIGSLAGSSQNSTTSIIQIKDTDITLPTPLSPNGLGCKLELINNTINMPSVTLIGSLSASNPLAQISASLSLFRLV